MSSSVTGITACSVLEGARRMALAHVEEAERVCADLLHPRDEEALHDFRVALRRLRGCLEAYRGPLRGVVKRKWRRRLRRLARSTGVARDTEVALQWLREREAQLHEDELPGFAWLVARLEQRWHDETQGLDKVARKYRRLRRKLASSLSLYRLEADRKEPVASESFAAATARLLAAQANEALESLAAIHSPGDVTLQHETRIHIKRLRYLLEPVASAVPGGERTVRRLKRLQDLFGDLHDVQCLLDELQGHREDARHPDNGTGERQDLLPGLAALQDLGRVHRQRLLDGIMNLARGPGRERLLRRARAFLDSLAALSVLEPSYRRVFLLHALPEAVQNVPVTEMESVVVPGAAIQEKLRSETTGGVTRFFREVHWKGGPSPAAGAEEEVSAQWYAAWRQLGSVSRRRRRQVYGPGPRTFCIDEDQETGRIHALLTTPRSLCDEPLPKWLSAFVVKEVTGGDGTE